MTTDSEDFISLVKRARELQQEAAVLQARLGDVRHNYEDHSNLLYQKYGTADLDELEAKAKALEAKKEELVTSIQTALESVEGEKV